MITKLSYLIVRVTKLAHVMSTCHVKFLLKLCNKCTLVWEAPGYPRNRISMGVSFLTAAHVVMKCTIQVKRGKIFCWWVMMPFCHITAVVVNGLTALVNDGHHQYLSTINDICFKDGSNNCLYKVTPCTFFDAVPSMTILCFYFLACRKLAYWFSEWHAHL